MTTSTPASTDTRNRVCPCFWSASGVGYLLVLLAGLAAGLWPRALYASDTPAAGAALPTLQTLAIAQIAWLLLVWPVVLSRRVLNGAAADVRREAAASALPGAAAPGERPKEGLSPNGAARATFPAWVRYALAALGVRLVLAVPFYVVAAWLADATAADAARTGLFVVCLAPLATAAGAYLGSRRPGRSWVLLAMMVLVLGLPWACYLSREFWLAAGSAEWLGHLTPATGAWSVAASRQAIWLPRPLWVPAIYLAAAAVLAAFQVLVRTKTGGRLTRSPQGI